MFRVVADQLKISDGWVRCGHCADVFDATLYLETWVPPAPDSGPEPAPDRRSPRAFGSPMSPAAPGAPGVIDDWSDHQQVQEGPEAPFTTTLSSPATPPPPLAPLDAPDAQPNATPESVPSGRPPAGGDNDDDEDGAWLSAPAPLETDRDDPFADGLGAADTIAAPLQGEPQQQGLLEEPLAPPAERPWPAPAPADSPAAAVDPPEREPDFHAELAQFAADAARPAVTAPLPLVAPEADAFRDADAQVSAPPPDPAARLPEPVPWAAHETDTPQAEPGFVRQARRKAFWRSPAVRIALGAVALALVLLLLAQWAVHERDTLAARHPALKPLLVQLCEPLGCQVGPARQIEAIVIDSTALVRRLGNFYSFDLVLKNTAPIALALPALELSLTDTSDAVIARRVFLPEELPGAPALIPAHDTVSISLRLSLAVGDALPMAGYRALVFYP